MAVFLTEKGKKKYKIYKKGSLPESNNILSHQAEACRRQETPPCLWLEGSFTLEAAVILPVMALFFVMILMFFRVMQVQMDVQKALDDTGRKLALWQRRRVKIMRRSLGWLQQMYFSRKI